MQVFQIDILKFQKSSPGTCFKLILYERGSSVKCTNNHGIMYGDHMLEKHFVAGQDSVFGFLYDTNYLSPFSVHFIDGTLSLSQHC